MSLKMLRHKIPKSLRASGTFIFNSFLVFVGGTCGMCYTDNISTLFASTTWSTCFQIIDFVHLFIYLFQINFIQVHGGLLEPFLKFRAFFKKKNPQNKNYIL